jgi:hypothetical protein
VSIWIAHSLTRSKPASPMFGRASQMLTVTGTVMLRAVPTPITCGPSASIFSTASSVQASDKSPKRMSSSCR